MYYHPKCVGLDHLKSLDEGGHYSNCDDGESYMWPVCEKNSKAMGTQACYPAIFIHRPNV